MILGILAIWIATGAIVVATVAYALLCRAARQEQSAGAVAGNGHPNGDRNGHGGANGHGGNGRLKLKGTRVKEARQAVAASTRFAPSIASLATARRAFTISALGVFVAAAALMYLVVGRHY